MTDYSATDPLHNTETDIRLTRSEQFAIDLLRRFEPIVRYTRGERFFPMNVVQYVEQSSLWVQRPGEAASCIVPEGELTIEALSEPRKDGFEAMTFMQFIEPLNIAELARLQVERRRERKDPRDRFQAGRGRLARVGYGSRLVDALFSLTLLARGRVPGDTAAAASDTYEHLMEADPHYQYYGRVLRQHDWIVVQYWFFYPYNNWRSGFHGVNDHEADWEQMSLYLYETDDGEIQAGAGPLMLLTISTATICAATGMMTNSKKSVITRWCMRRRGHMPATSVPASI